MKTRLIATVAVLLALAAGTLAHRLDEYLQATILSVEQDHILASMRLIPGVAVSSRIIASIDTNGDGVISVSEQRTYAERILHDLSITVDEKNVSPALVSQKFPAIQEIKEGVGEIQIDFTVDLPPGGSQRRIVFENHHQNAISAYLVNCLVPSDPNIRILAQNRNETQSFYQLDYAQPANVSKPIFSKVWSNFRGWISSVGFASIFRLGMRHIAEGTDHLLFLLVLLLPAPLLALGPRWAGFAGARRSLFQILKVVTAFTIGHSITLALAALGARPRAQSSHRSNDRSVDSSLRHSRAPSTLPRTRSAHSRILRPYSWFGICCNFGAIRARTVGARRRHSGLQPWHRNHATDRGRGHHSVSRPNESHAGVPISENRRRAVRRYCVRGLDRREITRPA